MLKTKTIKAMLLASVVFGAAVPSIADDAMDVLSLLDADLDGKINAYEVFDQLLLLQKELGKKQIEIASLRDFLVEAQAVPSETKLLMETLDTDENSVLTIDEVKNGFGGLAKQIDTNGDKEISFEELASFDIDEYLATFMVDTVIASEDEVREEVALIFDEFDANRDNFLTQQELHLDQMWSHFKDKDLNKNGSISRMELVTAFTQDSKYADFEINGTTAIMTGTIGPSTPAKVLELAIEHPEVTTILMQRVPGSIDDEANLRAAKYVRKFGLNTKLAFNSVIASGGTDFFLAGVARDIEVGAMVGVHSWGASGYEGHELAKHDEQHKPYIKYYSQMEIPTDFYWFTLDAAPANDIHWMTPPELEKYKFTTTQQ